MKSIIIFILAMTMSYVYADKIACYKALDDGDYTNALQDCKMPAAFGDATAQYNLGVIYDQGLAGTPDYSSAIYWYGQAANQSKTSMVSTIAQFNLGYMYYSGNKVKQDYAKAFSWLSRAANQKNAPTASASAQYYLGLMYKDGVGVTQNNAIAVYWLSQAANQGNTNADEILRSMYNDGQMEPAN